ncbi:hypothetical protein GQ457_01G035860 [Hibiscus cannabinus]
MASSNLHQLMMSKYSKFLISLLHKLVKALDFVVSEAKQYKIRLILSLINSKAQYVKQGNAAGLNLTSGDEFFSHRTLEVSTMPILRQTLFMSNEPTIFARELERSLMHIGSLRGYTVAPARTQFSPYSYATQAGTDFIRNHQALVLILHLFKFMWIPGKAYHSVLDSCSCVWQFAKDAKKYRVYKTLLNSTKKGGSWTSSLLWQLLQHLLIFNSLVFLEMPSGLLQEEKCFGDIALSQ